MQVINNINLIICKHLTTQYLGQQLEGRATYTFLIIR